MLIIPGVIPVSIANVCTSPDCGPSLDMLINYTPSKTTHTCDMICKMGKLLSLRDKILIGLSVTVDVHTELKSLGGFVNKRYKRNNYYSTVSRLLKSETIEKVVVKGEAKLRISSKGKDKLARDFPFLSFQNKKWDQKWRIVTFDIPEKKRFLRDKLRSKLKELGFGMLQQSIWISPHNFEDDIREYLELNKLGNRAYVFVSNKILVGQVEKLIEKLWKISEINELYIKAYEEKNKDIYFQAVSKDPFLPTELLPKDWFAEKAKTILQY